MVDDLNMIGVKSDKGKSCTSKHLAILRSSKTRTISNPLDSESNLMNNLAMMGKRQRNIVKADSRQTFHNK